MGENGNWWCNHWMNSAPLWLSAVWPHTLPLPAAGNPESQLFSSSPLSTVALIDRILKIVQLVLSPVTIFCSKRSICVSLVLINAGNQLQPMPTFCCSFRATHLLPLDIYNHQPMFHDFCWCKSRSWSFTPLSPSGKPKDDDSYTHPFISVRRNSNHAISSLWNSNF